MKKRLSINAGDKFGRFVVIEETEEIGNSRRVLCQCNCGNKKIVDFYSLRSGAIVSCGCYHSEKTKYINYSNGLYKTRQHSIWQNMKQRCNNPNYRRYMDYGGRGITICKEWLGDFKNFYDWSLKNGYKDSLTIDRIENNGNYEPNNCRWITNKEQQSNRRNNRNISYGGETKTLQKWSECLGYGYKTLQGRIDKGWSIEAAFTLPLQTYRRGKQHEA